VGGQRRRGAGELEAAILRALWEADVPLTPAALQAAVGTELAYNTVHTVLTRLCDKGVLARVQVDGRPAYRPVRSRTEHDAAALRMILDGTADRHALLRHFVDTLGPEDEAALRDLLGRTGD
jgi:predicted transcriptional regulator